MWGKWNIKLLLHEALSLAWVYVKSKHSSGECFEQNCKSNTHNNAVGEIDINAYELLTELCKHQDIILLEKNDLEVNVKLLIQNHLFLQTQQPAASS